LIENKGELMAMVMENADEVSLVVQVPTIVGGSLWNVFMFAEYGIDDADVCGGIAVTS
jgi:hypothetical protein